ncbi:uncharacterized protein L969DRAFT_96630 [Mixia osmundae IAM 14324]|uniref:60S ribosomal protein L31 n=1 Tax=Mixia osmundae (strain CBS 9802 / IAM 14324 / JCM 22182 / KY 12970) TaxID=764103 RepID=G7EB05_MIXOS|nr:uncharacterized protein L969DRAFT_96630 [Mixia osmundae IAM 14324]KEI37050.1 hypothetical protein L969DRAFT_96630 [Mixia osmundae IAM 14324]GAB00016.1 hypothetical protein E5Q_06718 [Mixia osmundae IAM 14324]
MLTLLSGSDRSIEMARTKGEKKQRSALSDVVTREYTIHLHKRVHSVQFKKRAPKAVKEVVKFAQSTMGTKLVQIDPTLNAAIWQKGVKDVPRRIRVRLSRKRNDDEDAKEKLLTVVSHVSGVTDFKGLQTQLGRRGRCMSCCNLLYSFLHVLSACMLYSCHGVRFERCRKACRGLQS